MKKLVSMMRERNLYRGHRFTSVYITMPEPGAPEGVTPVVRAEARPDFSGVKGVATKLLDKKYPEAGLDGYGRLGYEINLDKKDRDEVSNLLNTAKRTHQEAAAKTSYAKFQEIYNRQPDSFHLAMGGNIVEDPTVTEPIEVHEEGITKIKVPPDVYKLWNTQRDMEFVDRNISENEDGEIAGKGKDGKRVGEALNNVISFTERNLAQGQEVESGEGDIDVESLTSLRDVAGVLPSEITFGTAAAMQRIEHERAGGDRVEDVHVLEERAREIARHRMAEDREQWQGRFAFIRRAIPRWWKYTVGEVSTYNKEKHNATQVLAESGMQMTTLTPDFLRQVDVVARTNIQGQRAGMMGLRRVGGYLRDRANDITFTQGRLEQERVNVMRQLRQSFEDPANPAYEQFLRENPGLATAYNNLIEGDIQASESLASRLTSQFRDEMIHGVVGERAAEHAVELSPELKTVIGAQIIEPILRNGLTTGTIGPDGRVQIDPDVLRQARLQAQEIFFRPEFVQWYDQMAASTDPQVRQAAESFRLSLSYGTDLIPVIQEVMLPQLLQAKEHMLADNNLENYINNLVLKTNVGTLEAGGKNVINEGRLERAGSRAITNERVMNVYREIRDSGNAPQLVPDTYMNASLKRNEILSQALRVGTNPVLMGLAVGGGLYLARVGAGAAGRVVVPVLGGSAVAGVFRGIQEYRYFTRENEQHNLETEMGHTFAPDMRRRRQMDNYLLHMREMQGGLTDPMNQLREQIQNGAASPDQVQRLMGLVADTQARLNLHDTLEVGLLAAQNPQSYQIEKTNLELARAQANQALGEYLNNPTNQAQFSEIKRALGCNDRATVQEVMRLLTDTQQEHLLNGTTLEARFQTAFNGLTIDQAESINRRESAFRRARLRRTVTSGLLTFGMSAGGMLGMRWATGELSEALGIGKEQTTVPGRDVGGELRTAYGQNGARVDLGNGVFVESHVNANGPITVDGVASFTDANGPVDYPRPAFIDVNGSLVFVGQDSADIHGTLPTSVDGVVNGWTETLNNNPDYNLYEKFKMLSSGTKREEFQFGRTKFAIDPPHSPSNPTDYTVVKAHLDFYYQDPQTGSMEHYIGKDIYMGYDRATEKLVLDPANDGNIGKNLDEDIKLFKQEVTKDGYVSKDVPFNRPDIPQGPKIQSVDVMQYYEQRNMVADANRVYWHDNDTPFRAISRGKGFGADGKELQFYHNIVDQDGKKTVQLDFRSMKSHLLPDTLKGVNWDNTVDSQYGRLVQDIQNGEYKNFQVLMYPTDEQYNAGKAVIFSGVNHPELSKGLLDFDLNNPETRAMFNVDQNGNPIRNEWGNFQQPAFIEVAHVDPVDGTRTVLATTAGPGVQTVDVPVPQPAIPQEPTNGFELTLPKAYAFEPPAPHDVVVGENNRKEFGIPLFWPRRPLEQPEGVRGQTPKKPPPPPDYPPPLEPTPTPTPQEEEPVEPEPPEGGPPGIDQPDEPDEPEEGPVPSPKKRKKRRNQEDMGDEDELDSDQKIEYGGGQAPTPAAPKEKQPSPEDREQVREAAEELIASLGEPEREEGKVESKPQQERTLNEELDEVVDGFKFDSDKADKMKQEIKSQYIPVVNEMLESGQSQELIRDIFANGIRYMNGKQREVLYAPPPTEAENIKNIVMPGVDEYLGSNVDDVQKELAGNLITNVLYASPELGSQFIKAEQEQQLMMMDLILLTGHINEKTRVKTE